jgi:hypothetical protein
VIPEQWRDAVDLAANMEGLYFHAALARLLRERHGRLVYVDVRHPTRGWWQFDSQWGWSRSWPGAPSSFWTLGRWAAFETLLAMAGEIEPAAVGPVRAALLRRTFIANVECEARLLFRSGQPWSLSAQPPSAWQG